MYIYINNNSNKYKFFKSNNNTIKKYPEFYIKRMEISETSSKDEARCTYQFQ